jgi:alpha-1,2-mannosyltransferase
LTRRRFLTGIGAYGAGLAALALGIAVARLAQPHALLGIVEYDDGVYAGAALRLVHGTFPYRDFAFGHPPGILLLLLPLALIGGRTFWASGRIATAVVAAANVFLLVRLVRHRGPVAVLVAGLFLTFFPAAVFATRTLMLEPYLVLFTLLGATAMFTGDELAGRKRLLVAGVAFGFAGAVKIWAFAPAAVAIACCGPAFRRHLLPLVTGMAAGFAVPSFPFFVLAPQSFIRDVVTVQFERNPAPGALSLGERLVYLTGIPSVPSTALAAALAIAYAAVVSLAFSARPRPTRLEWFALGTVFVSFTALLVAPDFGFHYAYFSAAYLALLLSLAAGRLLARAQARAAALGRRGLLGPPSLRTAAVALVAIAIVVGLARSLTWRDSFPDPAMSIARLVPAGACVVTDEPALSVGADRFVATSRKCPLIVDPFFLWIATDPAKPPPSELPPSRLVREWQAAFSAADYVVLSSDPFRIPLTPELTSRLRADFDVVASDGVTVYRRAPR